MEEHRDKQASPDVPLELKRADFTISQVHGFDRNSQIVRHDPSNILKIDSTYHVWYTRFVNRERWEDIWPASNYTEIWLAVSDDGRHWKECGSVMKSSKPGAWHETGKHAPHVVVVGERFYLFFTAGHRDGHLYKKCLGLATADIPEGPFEPVDDDAPLLSPGGVGAFDVIGQDDACAFSRDGAYWLYFKGYGFEEETEKIINNHICAAVADNPIGPYRRLPANPITKSHTGCFWPHRTGVAMICDHAPLIVQYSDDGIQFHQTTEIVAGTDDDELRSAIDLALKYHKVAICDPGVHCAPTTKDGNYGGGIEWGLSQLPDERMATPNKLPHHTPFLVRFDCHLSHSH